MTKIKRKKIHESLYYALLTIVIMFISGSLFLISPLLIFEKIIYIYIIVIILGITLGAFLKGILRDLDELTHTHHAGLLTIILAAASINFITIFMSYSLLTEKTIIISFLIAVTFTISFLIPYLYHYYKNQI